MRKVHCIIGDNDNNNYRKEIDVEVTNLEAYAITHAWEDDAEQIYDQFCDKVETKFDLPESWYFDHIEDLGGI